ncbi:hypothetical protein RCCGEPOP_34212 [Rhizobium sp. Pop5]|nr:hypothetical protein RCCGEPOP_34212 [Rhizobium sp. Pop5]
MFLDVMEFKRVARWACRRGLYVQGLETVPARILREYKVSVSWFPDKASVEKRIEEISTGRNESFIRFRFEGEFDGLMGY